MEQLCLNRQERQKVYWKIYLNACLVCGITVVIALSFSHIPLLQNNFYAAESTPAEPVFTPMGENLFVSLIYMMALYYFMTRREKNKHFDKVLPVMAVWMAIPLQLIFYIIGEQNGLRLVIGAWFLLSISFLMGLCIKFNIVRYRQKCHFVLLFLMIPYLLSFFAAAVKPIVSFFFPYLVILFSIITIIEAQRIKQLLEKGIPSESFDNFYLAAVTNMFINFFGMIVLFNFEKVMYKLIVTDKEKYLD